MSNKESKEERDFLVVGARTYLDVDDAMEQFRRMVQDQCAAMLGERLDEFNRACRMDWTPNDLKDYKWRHRNGAHIGKQLTLSKFGGLYICFEISREKDSLPYSALVYLWRQRRDLAIDLWNRLDSAATENTYCQGNSLIFLRPILEDEIPDIVQNLNRAVDAFITFIDGCGGLRKYLPKGPQPENSL